MIEEIGSLLFVMEASTALMRQQMAEGERAVERTTRGMTASLEKVNTLFGLMDKAASQSSKNVGAALARARRETDINAWGAELDKLQARYDKTFAATKRFEAEVADLNRALKVGAISAEVYQEAMADVERRSNPATVSIRQQAQALDQLRSKYDPVYAEVRRYGEEQARVARILKEANASEAETARIMLAVAEAYDPATRAAKEYAQATHEAADAQRRMVEQARALQNQDNAQHWFNTQLGVTKAGRSGSASASASVFQEAADAADKEAKALERLEQRARALREGIDPTLRAQRLYNEAIRDADELHKEGKITYAEHTAAVNRARDALHQSTGTQVAAQRATKLTAYELTNLSFQLQDIGVSLAGGQNPFLVLAQQLPQASMAVGGLGRAMSLLLTPAAALVLAAASGAVALGTAFVAAEKYSNSIREVERVNRLTGGAVGLTTGALVEQSDALAGAAGLSRSSAREIQAAYVATGRIGTGVLGDLLTVTKDWAALTGQDLDKAKEELGDFFASPARAAEDLTRKLNLFSDAQLQAIRNAEEQGRVGQAQALLLDGIKLRAAGAAHNVSDLTRAWDAAGRFFSDFLDAVGQSNGIETTEKRVKRLTEEVLALQKAATNDAARVLAETGGVVGADAVPVDTRYTPPGTSAAAGDRKRADLYAATVDEREAAIMAFGSFKGDEFRRQETAIQNFARKVDQALASVTALTNAETLLNDAVAAGAATRERAAQLLDLYRMKVSGAAAAVAELSTQAQLLSVPEGFERRFAAAIMRASNGGQVGLSSDEIKNIREGEADVARGEVGNVTAQTERQAAAQRLLAGAISDTAKAQAQARVAFAEQLVAYPELGAATAKTALETKDFGAFVAKLPPDLQKLWQAMDSGAVAQVAGGLNQATAQMVLQTEAAGRLAAAAGQGEAAQRRANIENQVAAARMHGLEAATRAAAEAQEAYTRTQIHGEFAGQIEQEAQANERLAAAIGKGAAAAREAEIHNKAVAQTLREVPYPKAGQDTSAWNRALQANITLLGRQKNAADGVDLSRYLDQLKEARRGLEFQRSTLGLSDDEKTIAKARQEALDAVRKTYGEYEKLTGEQKDQADEALRAADAYGRLEVQVRHSESAYAAVGDAIDDGIVRPLESAIDAIVKGQGESIKWGNLLKGAFASVAVDAVKMATINPALNMMGMGAYRPSLWDLPMFASSGGSPQVAGAAGQAGGAGGIGNAVGIGSSLWNGGLYSQGLANAGAWFATSSVGQALGLSSTMTAANLADAGVKVMEGGMQVGATSMNTAGSLFSQGMGYSPWGIVGSVGASMLGLGKGADPWAKMAFSTMGSIGGGMLGAAAGGAMGGTIMGAQAGAVLGPIGAIIGAIIGTALSALIPADIDIPWGQVTLRGGKVHNAETLDGYDVHPLAESTTKVNDAIGKIAEEIGAKDFTGRSQTGIGVNNGKIYTFVGAGGRDGHGSTPQNMREFGQDGDAAFTDLIKRTLSTFDMADVPAVIKTALANSKAKTSEELAKDIDLAKRVADLSTAFDDLDNSMAGVARRAKVAAKDQWKTIEEEYGRAKDLGIGADYKSVLERQIREGFNPTTLDPVMSALTTVSAGFDAAAESWTRMGLSFTEAEKAGWKTQQLEASLIAMAQAGEITTSQLDAVRDAFPQLGDAIDRALEIIRKAQALLVTQVRGSAAATLNPYFRPSANTILSGAGLNPEDKPVLWQRITSALGNVNGDFGNNADVIGRLAQDIISGHQTLMATNPQAFQSIMQGVTGFAQAMQAQAQTISQGQNQINSIIRGGRSKTVQEVYQELGLATDAFPETARRLGVLFDAIDKGTAGATDWQSAFDGLAANLRTGKITGEQFSAILGDMTARMQTASQLIASGRSLSEWIDRLHSTPMGNSSPQEQATAAMDGFKRQVALARTGDATAYGNLTQYAETLLTAQRALSATGVDTSNVIGWVESTLKNLPAVQSWEQQQVALLGKIDANTAATAGGIGGVIGAINSGTGSTGSTGGTGGGTSTPAGLRVNEMANWSWIDVAQAGQSNAYNNRVSFMMSGGWKDAAGNPYSWDSARYLQLNPDVASFSISDANFLEWFGNTVADPYSIGSSFVANLTKLDQAQRHFIKHGASENRRFASGTPAAPPGWAWVGEDGIELAKLPGGTAIVPNPAAVSMAATWENAVERWATPAPVVPQMPDLGGVSASLAAGLGSVRDAVNDLGATVSKLAQQDQRQRALIADEVTNTLQRMNDTLDEIERRSRVA